MNSRWLGGPLLVVAMFWLLVLFAILRWRVPPMVLVGYALASGVCFATYAWDKSAAINGRRRTPELTLLLLGLVGGWPGAVCAQRWLRHKSRKASFQVAFWATVLVHVAVFIAGFSPWF